MAARNTPQHRKVGSALGYASDVADVLLRCKACSSIQTEPVDIDVPMRDQLPSITCLFCGRVGQMTTEPTTRAPR